MQVAEGPSETSVGLVTLLDRPGVACRLVAGLHTAVVRPRRQSPYSRFPPPAPCRLSSPRSGSPVTVSAHHLAWLQCQVPIDWRWSKSPNTSDFAGEPWESRDLQPPYISGCITQAAQSGFVED